MIIKRLNITNLYDNTFKSYDINTISEDISSLQVDDLVDFKDKLTAAIFGRDEALAPLASGLASEVNFNLNNTEYMLVRTYRDNGDTASLHLEGQESEICATIEEVGAFLAKNINISKYAFKKLIELDMASAEALFLKSSTTRNEYIASMYSNLVGNLQKLEDERSKLESKLYEMQLEIKLQPKFSREDATLLGNEIAALDSLIETEKEELAKVRADIAKGEQYSPLQESYDNLVSLQAEILSRGSQIEEIENRLDASNEALALSGLYNKKEEMARDITLTEREIDRLDKEIANKTSKIAKGEKAARATEEEYTLLERKSQELNKIMGDMLLEASANPLSLNIDSEVEQYYKEFNAELDILQQKKIEIDKLYNQVCTESAILEDRKKEIVLPARIKKAIAEGSLFEEFIANRNGQLAEAATELEQLKANAVAAKETIADKVASIDSLKAEINKLEESIKGEFGSIAESINHAVLTKQTLYGNHLLIASHEDEVTAIDTKIQRLEVDKGDYLSKIRLLKEAMEDLEEHKAKCEEKRQEFLDRKISVLGENKLADIINDIELGDSCPICSNFVTEKKLGTKIDFSALDAEIVVFDRLIEEDEVKMREVENTIGKYETALRVNGQYILSLQDTKQSKIDTVATILRDCKVENSIELEKSLRTSIEISNKLRFDNESLVAQKEKLAVMTRFLQKEQDALADLEKINIKEKEKEIADYKKELEKVVKEYSKFQEELKGEKPSSLLQKLNIVEKELETIEQELVVKLAQKSEVFEKKQELEQAISILSSKMVLVEVKGANYGYKEIVSKVISDKLSEIVREIRKTDAKSEDIKIKVGALHKLLAKQNMELAELNTQLDIQKARKQVLENTLQGLKENYEERFVALGITSLSDLHRLILTREEAIRHAVTISDYREERARNRQAVLDTAARLEALGEYYVAYADNLAREEGLSVAIEKNIFALSALASKRGDITNAIEVAEEKTRAYELAREQYEQLDNLLAAIPANSELLGKSLSDYIIKSAARLMWKYTGGEYTLSYKEDTIGLVNIIKDKIIKTYNASEKMLLVFIIAAAIRKVFDKLTQGNATLPSILTLKEGEASSHLGKVLAEYASYSALMLDQGDLAILKPLMRHVKGA